MDMKLVRYNAGPQGIFSHLLDAKGVKIAETLTHAYQRAEDQWVPIVAPGRYQCSLGKHTLDGVHWFDTYQIMNVAGHTGILFHQGNVENESLGCELLGGYTGTLDGEQAVLHSADAFAQFMKIQDGAPSFWLTVEEDYEHATSGATATEQVGSIQAASEGGAAQLHNVVQRPDSSAGGESGHTGAARADSGAVPAPGEVSGLPAADSGGGDPAANQN